MTAIVYKDGTLYADNSSQVANNHSGQTYFQKKSKMFSTDHLTIAVCGESIDFKHPEWTSFVYGDLLAELIKIQGIKNAQFTVPEGIFRKGHLAILITQNQVFVCKRDLIFHDEDPASIFTMGSEEDLLSYALEVAGKTVQEAYDVVLKYSVIGHSTGVSFKEMKDLKPLPLPSKNKGKRNAGKKQIPKP